MNTKQKIFAAFTLLGLGLSSCYKHNWETLHPAAANTPCSVVAGATISYSLTIKPILNAKCAQSGCHNGSTSGAQDFRTWGDSVAYAGTCSDFWQADTTGSNIANGWQYITGAGNGSSDKMPKTGSPQLTPCEIKAIGSWIHQGGLDN